MLTVAVLLFFGTKLVEQFLSLWSFVLYSAFIALIVLSFWRFGSRITDNVGMTPVTNFPGILSDGVTYAGYNIAAITTVLFCARHIESRRDALVGGLLGGPLAMIPGMLFFLAMAGYDPEIRSQTVPVEFLLGKLNMPAFRFAFLAIMAITLLGTCSAMIHAINERIAGSFSAAKRSFPRWGRATVAAVTMILSVVVADRVGLVALVAKGYQYMSWAFILVFMIPILTYGVWRLVRADASDACLPAE
jgi:uncharacterized membrane protein YkvI